MLALLRFLFPILQREVTNACAGARFSHLEVHSSQSVRSDTAAVGTSVKKRLAEDWPRSFQIQPTLNQARSIQVYPGPFRSNAAREEVMTAGHGRL